MSNNYSSELDITIKGAESIEAASKNLRALDDQLLEVARSADKADQALAGVGTGSGSGGGSKVADSTEKATAATKRNTEAVRENASAAVDSEAAMAKAWQKQQDSLSNTRYALYDVAALYGSIGIAATATVSALSGVNASYEKSFSDVARTTMLTGEALGELRADLIAMSQEMPSAFGDITAVATLGAQLGVASEDIAGFTETVSMFAATTDVTVERAAMGLGRTAQLTGTAGDEYENLAAAIYQTGVTSVATESAILSVTEQIATTGDLAGLSNHQIVALASSLASLGVAPEAARGSMMRIFDVIAKGAADGGQALEKIADVAGMSMDEISSKWGTDSQAVFSAFINGMGEMQDAGANTNAVLKDLGIFNVRDIRTVQLLANNTEVYAQSLEETSKAYREGTALADGYAIATDTLVDQLTRLKNNLMAIVGQGSIFNDFLKDAIGYLNSTLQMFSDIAGNPVGKAILGIAAAVAVSIAAWAGLQAAIALARGGLAAFITAQMGLQKAGAPLTLGLAGIAREFLAIGTGGKAALDRMALTGSAIDRTAKSSFSLAGAAKGAAAGLGALTKAFAPMAIATGVIMGATKAWEIYNDSQRTALEISRDMHGEIGGLADAIAADTQSFEDLEGKLTGVAAAAYDSAQPVEDWGAAIESATIRAQNTETVFQGVLTTIDGVTVAIGEQTQALINQSATERAMKFWEEHKDILDKTTFSVGEFTKILATNGDAEGYVSDKIVQMTRDMTGMTQSTMTAAEAWKELNIISSQDGWLGNDDYKNALQALADAGLETQNLGAEMEYAATQSDALRQANEATGVGVRQLGEDLEDTKDGLTEIQRAMDGFITSANSDMALSKSLDDLGASLYENGYAFDTFSQAGMANMSALNSALEAMSAQAGEDSTMFAGNVINMMGYLEEQGANTGGQLNWVYTMLNTLVGNQYGIDFSTKAARENIHQYIADLIAAEQASIAFMREQAAMVITPFTATHIVDDFNSKIGESEKKLAGLQSIQKQVGTGFDKVFSPVTKQIASGFDNAAKGASNLNKNVGNAGKSAQKTADAVKEVKKEIRTAADYARDLSGVFDDINEAVFGLRDAKVDIRETFQDILEEFTADASDVKLDLSVFDRRAARDGIVQTFIDLRDSAEEAEKAVRDSITSLKKAKADLQGLKAEGATLEYQLEVAKAWGNLERIAEIEAEIAKNKAEQVEAAQAVADAEAERNRAQAATSTTTTGNSQPAIDNRNKLRGLATEYMEYIDLLRQSGASEETIQEAVERSARDYAAQAEALGFSTDQFKPYQDGIFAMSGKIEANSTALKGNSDQLDKLYQEHVDSIAAFAATGASQEEIAKFAKKAREEFYSQAQQLGYSKSSLGQYETAWGGLFDAIEKIPRNVTIKSDVKNPSAAPITKFIQEQEKRSVDLSSKTKKPDGSKVTDYRTKQKNTPISIPVTAKPSGDGKDAGRAAGKAYADGWVAAVTGERRVKTIIDKSVPGGKKYQMVNSKGQSVGPPFFRKGGYTGNGHPDDAAGIVHAGEYVFPYEATDQSTGLPKASALISMLGSTLGSSSFMAGGQMIPSVNMTPPVASAPQAAAGNGISLVELMPSQLNMLGEIIVRSMPQQPMLSQITHAVNQVNNTRSGKGQG